MNDFMSSILCGNIISFDVIPIEMGIFARLYSRKGNQQF